ncbi:MAG TPA: glycosyltransferase [Phototrophicaceae bacterium]|nr:glycosyltransferase [Phototrophicaceae bacterium]
MGKLLAISWGMPPVLTPNSILIASILKYLARAGWETTVITSHHEPPWQQMRYDPELATNTYSDQLKPLAIPSIERYVLLRALWQYVPRLRPVPDQYRLWANRAVQAAPQALNLRTFDAIFSFGGPWSAHLVGLELQRLTGLPWLTYFSDPWVDSPYTAVSSQTRDTERRLEEAVIGKSDRVVFITSQTVDLVMAKYPAAWRDKVRVIPHGYDSDRVRVPAANQPRGARLKLAYTGTFYGIRSPLPLFQALQRLQQKLPVDQVLEVQLIGQISAKYGYQQAAHDLGLDSIVQFKGELPYTASLEAMAAADVLLVIDAPSAETSVFLPSKLVEYLPFRKPIFGITPTVGASADLLRRLECYVAAPDQVAEIETILRQLIDHWQAGELRVSPAYEAVMQEYDLRRTTQQFVTAIQEVVG